MKVETNHIASRISNRQKRISQKYNKKYKQRSATKTSLGKDNSDPQLYPVKEPFTFIRYVIEEWSLGYVHIKTFTTTPARDSFRQFREYFAQLKSLSFQKFIIDVHGNDCGKIVLGYLLANFLVPHEFRHTSPLKYSTCTSSKYDS